MAIGLSKEDQGRKLKRRLSVQRDGLLSPTQVSRFSPVFLILKVWIRALRLNSEPFYRFHRPPKEKNGKEERNHVILDAGLEGWPEREARGRPSRQFKLYPPPSQNSSTGLLGLVTA